MKNIILILLFFMAGMLFFSGCNKQEMKVTTGDATQITATTATVSGQIISTGEGVKQYGHCYARTPNPTIADTKTELGSPAGVDDFTSYLTNLERGTKYYTKAYLSSNDVTVYGGEINFTTELWSRYSGNPVMHPGSVMQWDKEFIGMGCVIYYNNKYHMWYTGGSMTDYQYRWRIGHATSDDGIIWEKDPSNPVLDKGPAGSWDAYFVHIPRVIVINNTFHMWYAGKRNKSSDGEIQIGHATSTDGTTWTKDANNPVLKMGSAGTWDNSWIVPGDVLYDGTKYHMWYSGNDTLFGWVKIGHASSIDAQTWTKDPANPVLVAEGSGSWEYTRVENPTVLFNGTTYNMWFTGGVSIFNWKIGHATSTDGITWTKDPLNPVLSPDPSRDWESLSVANMSVMDSSGVKYKIWYFGNNNSNSCIGYAELPHD